MRYFIGLSIKSVIIGMNFRELDQKLSDFVGIKNQRHKKTSRGEIKSVLICGACAFNDKEFMV